MYRIWSGAPIHQSSYDYDTKMIGPFKCPLPIGSIPTAYGKSGVSEYSFYKIFNQYPDILAVFRVNNALMCCIHKDGKASYLPLLIDDERAYRQLPDVPECVDILVPDAYEHIGYLRTYKHTMNEKQFPDHLVRNMRTKRVPYIDGRITGEPLLNPSVSLYKQLIDTDHKAVYFDLSQSKVVFVD